MFVRGCLVNNFCEELSDIFSVTSPANKQLIYKNTACPVVDSCTMALIEDHLRSDVGGSPTEGICSIVCMTGEVFGKTKICL